MFSKNLSSFCSWYFNFLMEAIAYHQLYDDRVRSLNQSNAVGIVLYEAIRQLGPQLFIRPHLLNIPQPVPNAREVNRLKQQHICQIQLALKKQEVHRQPKIGLEQPRIPRIECQISLKFLSHVVGTGIARLCSIGLGSKCSCSFIVRSSVPPFSASYRSVISPKPLTMN